jgi:hypothetical protein
MNQQLQKKLIAKQLIAEHDDRIKFQDLINNNREVFRNSLIVYGTNNIYNVEKLPQLKAIDENLQMRRPIIGSGLKFYSDEIWREINVSQKVNLPIYLELILDKNIAEQIRIFCEGGNVQRKESLLKIAEAKERYGLNYDYAFFIYEDMINQALRCFMWTEGGKIPA